LVHNTSCSVCKTNVWSIDIENYISAYFKTSDFNDRKKHRGEFIGFSNEHIVAKTMEMTSPFNPKSTYKQSLDKIIIKFQNVKGYPIGYNWPQRDKTIVN
jgi:hypothetical protein